jgi:ComF family protein
LYAVHVATSYRGLAKELIARFKFSGARAAAAVVAGVMSPLVIPQDAVIVPIPTATSRVRLRGYDQATLIAKALASQTNQQYAPALRRTGQHRQVGSSRAQRLKQMKDSFLVWDGAVVQGRHIILVDDVMTTGATLESAADILKTAGAKRVQAVVFARA